MSAPFSIESAIRLPPDRKFRLDIRALIDDPSRIQLVAQPIVDLKRGVVAGYEALSRFQVEPRTSPDRVFAEATRQGLGAELEATVVARALDLAAQKPENCFFTFNVDPAHLLSPELERVLEGRDLRGLVVELTEHREVEDSKPLVRQLAALRERGAMIAVDDAGSGYSGLKQLLELRPELVKVDRELVTNVHEDAAKYALIQMLGELAGRLDAWLLAEGIETESELRVLRHLGVPLAQGYFLARPAPPWVGLNDSAKLALSTPLPTEATKATLQSVVEPCQVCSNEGAWPDSPLCVRLSAEGRPVGMRLSGSGGAPLARKESELLRVKVDSSLSEVARRAATRPDAVRWDPLVCVDEAGRFGGVVRMHRLVTALAER